MLTPADILLARRRITGIAYPTPLEYSRPISAYTGAEVYLKLECAQVTGSFKVRGATNALLSGGGHWPVVACSAGNHALGVAHAAAVLGIEATLVLPNDVSSAKLAALRRYPAQIVIAEGEYDEAELLALRLASEENLRFISPYNHPEVIAGQGTVGLEMLEQLPNAEILLVSVGGGGLISGIALWAKAINPAIKVVGVQAEHSAAMLAALQAGQLVTVASSPTLADSLAGNLEPDAITFPMVQQLVDLVVAVGEEQIAAAMRYMLHEHQLVVEGAAAVVIAALLQGLIADMSGRKVIALLCGRNVSAETILALAGTPQLPSVI